MADTVFQHDNVPIHTTSVTKHHLERNSIKTMCYPGQSIELNPIENWAYIEGKLAIFKCYQILEDTEIGVGKCGNFKMLKALKECFKNISFLEKSKRKGYWLLNFVVLFHI